MLWYNSLNEVNLFLMDSYFAQIEGNVRALVSDRKFKEAYALCKQLLASYPDDRDAQKLKDFVEKEIVAVNERVVESEISTLKELFAKKDYPELVKRCKRLLKLSPENKEVIALMNKAVSLYQKDVKSSFSELEDNLKQRLESMFKERDERLTDELFSLERSYLGNSSVRGVIEVYREKLIERMIKEKENLIYSDNFGAIDSFVRSLEDIAPRSKRLMELKESLKFLRFETQKNDKREFMYKGFKHFQTLLRLKKYDKVLQLGEELLSVEPKNRAVRSGCRVARRRLYGVSRDDCVELLVAGSEEWRQDFGSSPSEYVRI